MNFGSILRVALFAGGGLMATLPLSAHHSFQAQYDESQSVTLTGTIKKVVWKSPHVHLDFDRKAENGVVENWNLELASPNALLQQGWKVDSLKAGDQITVTGYAAKDGSHVASIRKVAPAGR